MNQAHNPHAEQMGSESMIRNLAFQATAIWPQEQALFDRYGLEGPVRILDLGCGTGEITRRLAEKYPQADIVGIDILEANLMVARRDSAAFSARVSYEVGDAFALQQAAASFDLVVCRHLSQSVPNFQLVLAEISRVLKPGGWLHLLSEDYGMLHMPTIKRYGALFDPDKFWSDTAIGFIRSTGCDGYIGRHAPPMLEVAGYREISMDYVTVDTLRVDRTILAGMLRAWSDGFSEALANATARQQEEVAADFRSIIEAVETPPKYAVWHVPVVAGKKAGCA